jgi:hypothetical protein
VIWSSIEGVRGEFVFFCVLSDRVWQWLRGSGSGSDSGSGGGSGSGSGSGWMWRWLWFLNGVNRSSIEGARGEFVFFCILSDRVWQWLRGSGSGCVAVQQWQWWLDVWMPTIYKIHIKKKLTHHQNTQNPKQLPPQNATFPMLKSLKNPIFTLQNPVFAIPKQLSGDD